jgi:hypothetical protein
LSVATRSREDVNSGGADVNGRRSNPLIPSHNQPGRYIWPPKWGVGVEGNQLMNDVGGGGAALEKEKKGVVATQ